MRVTEEDLRANYELLETEKLLKLQASGTLTETAARILEQVLIARHVSSEEREKSSAAIEKQISDQDKFVASLASIGERVGAQLIDSVVASSTLLLSVLIGLVVAEVAVAGIAAGLLYLLFSDAMPQGQSVGKRALGIAVIDQRTRRPCTYLESFMRNILLMVLGIVDWFFVFGRTRQRLGDKAANTIVVRLRRREEVLHTF